MILTVLGLASCKPLKNLSPADYEAQEITKNNYEQLNGEYKNIQDTVFGQIIHLPGNGLNENNKTLNNRLFLMAKYGYLDSLDIKLHFVSKRKCVLSGIYQSDVLFSKKIRGKIKKGYFYVRPKFYIVPFFPLFYIHRFKRVRITTTKTNHLVVDHTERTWGFALFAGGLDKGRVTAIYEKK